MRNRIPLRKVFTRTLVALLLAAMPAIAAETSAPPRLTVVIVVDQLTADRPLQLRDRLGDGGFRRFLDEGVVYRNAHYRHASTYTAAGHATISTGTDPRVHGIISNRWLDPHTGAYTYCVADATYTLLDTRTKPGNGASPRRLLAPTLGDALIASTGPKAKVYAVSGKDRAAVLSAGKNGKAFWYSHTSGGMISSTYYYDTLPAWAARWNAQGLAGEFAGGEWPLLNPRETYTHANDDDRAIEASAGNMGRTFPHPLTTETSRRLYEELYVSPFLDEMTAAFAKTLLSEEQLGADDVPDLLFLSLSSTDTVGHQFGPFSLEVEDNFLRLDRTLADFMAHVDGLVGREHVVYALTSDHGVDGNLKNPDGDGYLTGILSPTHLKRVANDAIVEAFGKDGEFARGVSVPCLYLDEDALRQAGIALSEAERAAAEALRTVEGVAGAVTRTALLDGTASSATHGDAMLRSFHPDRSGHVYIVQQPYHRITSNPTGYTATHGTPYDYDTHVPLYVWTPHIAPAAVTRRVGPQDIAPALARLMGIPAPNPAEDGLLTELLPK